MNKKIKRLDEEIKNIADVLEDLNNHQDKKYTQEQTDYGKKRDINSAS